VLETVALILPVDFGAVFNLRLAVEVAVVDLDRVVAILEALLARRQRSGETLDVIERVNIRNVNLLRPLEGGKAMASVLVNVKVTPCEAREVARVVRILFDFYAVPSEILLD